MYGVKSCCFGVENLGGGSELVLELTGARSR